MFFLLALLLSTFIATSFMTIVFWLKHIMSPMNVLDGSHFHWGSVQREKPTDSSADCKVSNMYLWNQDNQAKSALLDSSGSFWPPIIDRACEHCSFFNGSFLGQDMPTCPLSPHGFPRRPHTLGIDSGPSVWFHGLTRIEEDSQPCSTVTLETATILKDPESKSVSNSVFSITVKKNQHYNQVHGYIINSKWL